eukprot:9788995-Ditylum_brightwellii.AAC.1
MYSDAMSMIAQILVGGLTEAALKEVSLLASKGDTTKDTLKKADTKLTTTKAAESSAAKDLSTTGTKKSNVNTNVLLKNVEDKLAATLKQTLRTRLRKKVKTNKIAKEKTAAAKTKAEKEAKAKKAAKEAAGQKSKAMEEQELISYGERKHCSCEF